MTDSKYFTTTKKGEIYELKSELNNDKKEKKKKLLKSMTVGKDVSALFPDVVNCMQTDNLELKKLVYLYLMNYAKSQPDMAIMAVNTFVKDCEDPNPLIRALAVRTMGCIRVDKITEYLCEPLRKCLKDEDPYVRKTAAVCVAKLYDISSGLVEDQGFLDQLKDLLSDSNPMVVANAVAALSEINESSPTGSPLVELNTNTINKLLTALNECTEWGQVFILDSLSNYSPKDEREAQSICERITPRLAHANAAVVLSAVKVLMKMMEILAGDTEFCGTLSKKLAPPLVTLLSSEPEVQYVALRNINLIVQKRPDILKHEMKVFFVKYNDPIYVKLEKLDIMIRLASQANIAQVLSELKEYATEVDVDFVRKAVRAIGRFISYPVLSTLLLISFGIFVIERKFRKLPMDDYTLALRMQNYTPRPLVDSDETQFKELEIKKSKFNFAEVDYLSFRKNEKLINEVAECIKHYGVGTCGPRHFYGSTDVHYALEQKIASFLNVEDAIVYSYGYSTIASSVACYCQLGDLVFIDDLCNISIVMGMASRKSTNIYFEHNNPHAFQKILEKMNKQYPDAKKILIIEGIYAKDGSICPLKKFIKIAKRYKVRIFIDESISFGTLGKEGRGITEYYQININEIDMIIGSLEHALHSNGGFCAGSQNIIEHQRLSSGGYIFSASLQTFSAKAALIALQNIGNKTLTLRVIALRADKF
ncbi:adaptor complex subunit beta family member [Holotrichia oblita]|uniref:Adaptor complex subunit beta family member n=1 Tax=Holotrichia oblita TaxID=644536 RepID=A0ACB9SHQ0_HOLOL|nr:adaptor complex subunit beta family member [Holotrichia oblita]